VRRYPLPSHPGPVFCQRECRSSSTNQKGGCLAFIVFLCLRIFLKQLDGPFLEQRETLGAVFVALRRFGGATASSESVPARTVQLPLIFVACAIDSAICCRDWFPISQSCPAPASDHGTSPARGARQTVDVPRCDIPGRVKVSPSRSWEAIETNTIELEVRDAKIS
jgi:hypothetical protein